MRTSDAPDGPAPALPPALGRGVEDFLEAMRVEAGVSRNTLAAYRADLSHFLRWAGPRIDGFADVDADLVVDYLDACREGSLAESTTARRLSAIRMCLRHLVAEGVLSRDPLVRIAAPRLRRALPGTLSVDEVERLLRAPGGEGWAAQRDRAFLEVLYACGARVAEAVGLETHAIEPTLRVLTLTGKGNKTRIVPLGERARAGARGVDRGRAARAAGSSSARRACS